MFTRTETAARRLKCTITSAMAHPPAPASPEESITKAQTFRKAIGADDDEITGGGPRASAASDDASTKAITYRKAVGADDNEVTGGRRSSPSARRRAPPKSGEVIGHYELIRQLGQGGMGAVYLARDTKLGRRVAIKFLHATDAETGERFIAEARATAQCSHENIVVIHEADVTDGRHYMVLEYLQGRSLDEVVPSGEVASPARTVELMLPVVRALVCAHTAGIVHRDLKLQNVIVTDSGTVKVLDFGIAAVLGAEVPNAKDTVPGTLSVMSPEQWNAEVVDQRSDLWSAGIMLFRLLAGAHPLAGKRGSELAITADLSIPMPSLRTVAPSLPGGLADVVDRCLKKARNERYQTAQELLAALEAFDARRVQRELKQGEAPYAGLSSFQEADSARFFGRTQETMALVTRLRAEPMIAVVGSSGSGKSSFIRAGVVPALKHSGEAWQVVVVRPARRPLEVLVDALLQLTDSAQDLATDLAAREGLLERLRHEPGYAGAALRAHARRTGRRVLLFIDQFEELYTQVADHAERVLFTTCLSSIADDATSPARVVLSLRADFLDRVAEDPRFLAELSRGLFLLGAPRSEGLREALVQPAEMAGYRFESDEIIEDMLAHLEATQGALPLLQFAAARLWDARDSQTRLLTLASYRAFGGIAGALAAHADAVLRQLPTSGQQLARVVLPRLVTPERTRALVSLDELKEMASNHHEVTQLVDRLVQARLLVVQTAAGSATVELAHESLIAGWPLLRRWLDEGREDQAFREQLRTAARQWEARGRAPGLLWSGDALEEARLLRHRHGGALPEKEQAFLDAAFVLATRAQRARRAVVIGTITLLTLLVVGGAVALVQVRRAQEVAVVQAQLAQREAERARAAEVRVSEQLAQLQREQAAKALAEAEVARGKGDLREANQRLEIALDQARVESAAARASARQATVLAGSLQTANTTLSRLLSEERARTERLEKERRKITTELR
jgi:hypothetical protein